MTPIKRSLLVGLLLYFPFAITAVFVAVKVFRLQGSFSDALTIMPFGGLALDLLFCVLLYRHLTAIRPGYFQNQFMWEREGDYVEVPDPSGEEIRPDPTVAAANPDTSSSTGTKARTLSATPALLLLVGVGCVSFIIRQFIGVVRQSNLDPAASFPWLRLWTRVSIALFILIIVTMLAARRMSKPIAPSELPTTKTSD